jgi:hypothetical protein
MVAMPDFAAPQAAEIFLSPIGASAVEAVGFLMIDALHFIARM